MGLIEFFKGLLKSGSGGSRTLNEISQFEMFNAYRPAFRSWGGNAYESLLVRQSVEAHAKHVSKLKFEMQGSAHGRLRAAMMHGPNEFESWPEFLERCSNIYRTQNNLFIAPVLDDYGEVAGFWPLYPTQTEVKERRGIPYLVFSFANGKTMAMELRRIAAVKRYQLQSDFFGESNAPLNQTLEMDAITTQGIIEGIKNASSYQFMAELSQTLFEQDVQKERRRFDELNFGEAGGRGLLLFNGNLKNVKQLEQGKLPVDADQMRLIENHVYSYFGTNQDILQNTADSVKLNAFYDGEVEPFAIKLSEALSRIVYTQREMAKNRIYFAANRLQYMNISEKVNVAKELGDRGAIMIDEIRELFNYPPLPDGKGQHAPIRGEYYYAGEDKTEEVGDGADGGGAGDAAGEATGEGAKA